MQQQEAAAVRMYDHIRSSTTDIQSITSNTGLKEFQVARVKNHLFLDDSHQLRSRVGRFDPDYEIASAWKRMETGTHTPQDVQLFKHEYFESRFEKLYRTDYGTAHTKTQLRYPSPLD
jgi:filamentous hemagglutinin